MNKRVEAVERMLESKMPEEVNRLIMQIEKNRLEFLDSRDNLEKQISALEAKAGSPPSEPPKEQQKA
jgi:hypothetical protein